MASLAARLAQAEAALLPVAGMPATPLALAEAVGFTPDEWQRNVLADRARRLLMLACRQSGKSTTTALLALHAALVGELVLLLSPTQRQSVELLRKVRDFLGALGNGPMVAESTTQLELGAGGRIVALPGYHEGNIRGFSSLGLLVIDEAARVDDALYQSARPMLAVSGGRLVALSTPWGKRGWFHREWTDGGPTWARVDVPATRCPRISPEFLEEERRTLGPLAFASEYECRFVDTEQNVFSSEEVLAALDPSVKPLFPVAA
jgi:hypothetical protein